MSNGYVVFLSAVTNLKWLKLCVCEDLLHVKVNIKN